MDHKRFLFSSLIHPLWTVCLFFHLLLHTFLAQSIFSWDQLNVMKLPAGGCRGNCINRCFSRNIERMHRGNKGNTPTHTYTQLFSNRFYKTNSIMWKRALMLHVICHQSIIKQGMLHLHHCSHGTLILSLILTLCSPGMSLVKNSRNHFKNNNIHLLMN